MLDKPTIAILDNNDRLLCVTDDYYDGMLHTFLQGTAAFFKCSVIQKAEIAKYFTVGNKISFVSNGKAYHFDITQMSKNEQTLTIQADSLTLELRNEFASEYKATKAMTFKQYLDVFLFSGDNPIELGINEVSDKSLQAEWTGDGESVLARLFSLANKFDAEIEFETVFNKHWGLDKVRLNVYRAHSDKYQGIGRNRTDVILEYGNNVETIEYEENIDDLKTAIRPEGDEGLTILGLAKTEVDEYGNTEYFTFSESGWIYAPQARDRFPSNLTGANTNDRYIGVHWSFATKNKNVLYGQALAKLKKLCEPNVTVTIKGYEELNIGDTVLVQNTGYVPTLNLSARISEQEIYFDEPSRNASTFTNVEILQSQVDQSLIDRVNALIEETRPYTVNLITDNGVNFKNSEGSTTLSAVVYSGTKEITPDVTVRWYKNDVWVKTAYSLTVNASDIVDKAVYRAEVMDTNGVIRAKAEVTVFNVDDGRGIKGKPVLSYASSGSINTVPTTWQSTIPSVPSGSYLWTREVTTYSDNTTSEIITPVLQGPKGDPGSNGKSITDSKQEWAASTSGTTAPTTWNTTIPTVSAGQYLWSRVTETWSDDSKTYRYTIGKIGENGQNAQMMFLSADKNTMMFNADNTAKFAQTATITAKYQNVSGTVVFTAKGIKADGSSEALTLTGSGDSRTITSAMFKTDWVMITVTATLAGLTDTLSIIKVNDGAQGIGGDKGYFHSAWAMSADGKTGFSTTVSEGKWYIGTYFDFVEADSTDPTKYNWLELAGAVKMYFAYAWSPDGTDRFIRKYPSIENLASELLAPYRKNVPVLSIQRIGNSIYGQSIYEITNTGTNSNWNWYREPVTDNKPIPKGTKITISFWAKAIKGHSDGSFSNLLCNSFEEMKTKGSGRYVYQDFYVSLTTEMKYYTKTFVSTGTETGYWQITNSTGNGYTGGEKFQITNLQVMYGDTDNPIAVPSIVDDYDNAVPRYIGRSLKDSNSPADYTWEPNPERKPWVSYAQGVNGEDLSIYPYNPNIALGTDATQKKGVFANASVTNGDYAELTITSKDNYAQIQMFDGFSMKPKDYEPGSKVTVSFELMYTTWNVPSNATIQEFAMYQRWMAEAGYASIWNVSMPRVDGTNVALNQWIKVSGTYTVPARSSNLESYQEMIQLRSNAAQSTITFRIKADTFKVELGDIPTPWTPAPSEDPLGAIPKYVGTAPLPYTDPYKYEWKLNPEWLRQESDNNLANKVDNKLYNNDQTTVWKEISNRVTEEEAKAIRDSLVKVTNAYNDFVSTGGKHDKDLANLKRAINTDIQKLADKVLGFDFVNTWFRIGDGGLSIGEANSKFELLISNDQITFYDSGAAVAYVSNQSFFINSGMIVNDLQIGKFKMVAINDNLMGLFHIS